MKIDKIMKTNAKKFQLLMKKIFSFILFKISWSNFLRQIAIKYINQERTFEHNFNDGFALAEQGVRVVDWRPAAA